MNLTGGWQAGPSLGSDRTGVGFKLHLRPVVVPGEATYLVSRLGVTALRGEHAELLVPLLDGTRDLEGVLRDAAPGLDSESVLRSLDDLTTAGLLRLHPRGVGWAAAGGAVPGAGA
ncbi:TOMM precursor leader peptide-binding protein, partial [Streptomyces sp. NPDC059900]